MTYKRTELAQTLVSAFDELLIVHEIQKQRGEEARQQAQAKHNQMMQMLQAAQSEGAKSITEALRANFDRYAALSDHASMMSLHRRWMVALTECDGLLMRLYAFAEAQTSAEKIAEYIKAIRLIEVADEEIIAPPKFDPTPLMRKASDSEDTPDERQQRKVGMAVDFFSGMDEHVAKVQQNYADKTVQTEQLLRQAKDEAEKLLALAGAIS